MEALRSEQQTTGWEPGTIETDDQLPQNAFSRPRQEVLPPLGPLGLVNPAEHPKGLGFTRPRWSSIIRPLGREKASNSARYELDISSGTCLRKTDRIICSPRPINIAESESLIAEKFVG
jgi:hypothetical protein